MSKKRRRRPQNAAVRPISKQSSATSTKKTGPVLSALVNLWRRLHSFFKASGKQDRQADKSESIFLSRLLKKGASALIVIVVVVVLFAVLSDLFAGDKVVFKPFLVSSELQGKLNDEIIAKRLIHDISVMVREANSVKKSQGFDVPLITSLPDVQLPASNVSVKALVEYVQAFRPLRYVKRKLGVKSAIEVNGEVLLEDDDNIRISLHITKDNSDGPRFTGKPNKFDVAFAEACEFIMANTEPYLYAVYLYQKKKPGQALGQVQYFLQEDPAENRRLALLLWGLILMDEKKHNEAIAKFEEATRNTLAGPGRERELAVAYNNWGLGLLSQCKTEEAIAKFKEAIQIDPNLALTYSNYGKALIDSGKTDEAEQKLYQALKLDADIAAAYFNLGYIFADNKPDESIAKYRAAINRDPNYVRAYSGLGAVLVEHFSSTRTGEAIEMLNKAIELDGQFAPAYINRALAWAYAPEANFKKAIEDGEKAVSLYGKMSKEEPGCIDFTERFARAYNNLGWFYEEDKNFGAAVANYQNAIDLLPKYHYAYTGKADALRKWGGAHVKEALETYTWVLQQQDANQSSRVAAYKGLGRLLREKSRGLASAARRADLEKAISMFEDGLKLRPNDGELKQDLTEAKAALGNSSR